MVNRIARNVLLAVLSFLLSFVIYIGISYAVDPVPSSEGAPIARDYIKVEVHYVDSGSKDQTKLFFEPESLKKELMDIGFRKDGVNILAPPDLDPREYLKSNPIDYLVTNFIFDESDKNTGFGASIYSPNAERPEKCSKSSQRDLISCIVRFIYKDEAFNDRVKTPRARGEEFAQHLDNAKNYILKKEFDEAIAEYNLAMLVDNSRVEPCIGLALAYRDKGDQKKRKEYVELGLTKERTPLLLHEQALIFISEGSFSDAIKNLENLVADHPKDPDYNHYRDSLAVAYIRSKERHLAVDVLNEINDDNNIRPDRTRITLMRLEELERKEDFIAGVTRSLWVAFTGLICITIVALIALLFRRSNDDLSGSSELSKKDLIALRVQLAIALLGGLFSVLLLILPKILGD